ncbi:hypothetical protein ACDW_31600 [Acidovorax sp. DW039]|uniref:hypothetical protein n=1 Tax=Acidovorax sp. DW039 TaxID=3095606 RepID=UPI00308C42AE|nr:hypothetical protein ACDW_31600 [Acidovorax sp. DW039]
MKTRRTLRPTVMQRLQALREQVLQLLWQWAQRLSQRRMPTLVPVRIQGESPPLHDSQRRTRRLRAYSD